jgi:ubiquinone/menaquinone biosynthesis C-methylase UbiE
MLRLAPVELSRVQGDAERLAFATGSVDAVCCLEALEFMPHADRALAEVVRVLKAGGVLLLSNRVGRDAWFLPGRLCSRGVLESRLAALGCTCIRTETWQVHYDLVWARGPAAEDRR